MLRNTSYPRYVALKKTIVIIITVTGEDPVGWLLALGRRNFRFGALPSTTNSNA
jgi:hypothetical protein